MLPRCRLRKAVASTQVQGATQFIAGQLLVNLFVFVRTINFQEASMSEHLLSLPGEGCFCSAYVRSMSIAHCGAQVRRSI